MPILSQQKQSQAPDFPNVRPSLDLRFALAKKLDPRITFTRGSTGTYFGPDGLMKTAGVNEPRFDHDPITGQSLGLLIEESRQNLLTYSNDFTNAVWTPFPNTIPSANQIGLDGTTSAFTYTTLSTPSNYVYQNFTCAASTTYTFSFYVKLGTLRASSYKIAVYNNTASSFIAADVVPTQTLSSSSWARVSYTFTTPAGCTSARVYPYRNTNALQNNGTIFLWGAQVEAGAFPTSYIPTSGSTATRTADLASMTGTNFSSWYNQNEGTIYVNNKIPYIPNPKVSLYFLIFGINAVNRHSIEQTTANGLIYITQNSGGIQYWTTSGSGVLPANTNRRTTYAYSSSNSKTLLSGTSNQTYTFSVKSTTDVYKSMTTMYIGRFSDSLYFLNGTISRLTYYPIQLTNQQLINLTL